MLNKGNALIFTDLDGTLIDFETYSFDTAAPLARQLLNEGSILAFCSSKTYLEQMALMNDMGISVPGIVENGCGLFLPPEFDLQWDSSAKEFPDGGRLIAMGVSADQIRYEISLISNTMGIDFLPYSEMNVAEICEITGLDEWAARRAQMRDFSETLTASLPESIWEELDARLEIVGLQCLSGGRFHTVSSRDCNKGTALRILANAIQETRPDIEITLGIGDSANDRDMLEAADRAYLVQQSDGNWNSMNIEGLNRIPKVGPEGWVQAVTEALAIVA